MIEIKNLVKTYGNKKVCDNVSFNIQKGKITSFIGDYNRSTKEWKEIQYYWKV